MVHLAPKVQKFDAIITKSTVIEDGTPTRYHLKTSQNSLAESEPYKKFTFGERDKNKPHKAILLVGETGTGKTKLINTMVNYMLGVQREDKVWFEITDDQSDQSSVHSQTSSITVYGFYLKESPMNLTIIDTPGYGDTRGVQKDKEIAMNLLGLNRYLGDWNNALDAVCLVIKATQNRLSDRQSYINDAVQSLFGKDIAENIVLLLTYSRGAHPKVALTAVKEANIQCAVNEQNQPVFFLFDNCQGETFLEEYQHIQEQSWNLSLKGIKGFFSFFDTIKPKPMKMTQDVLKQQEQLEANVSKIQLHDQDMEKNLNIVKQLQNDLEKYKKVVEDKNNFEKDVEVSYREKVDVDPAVAKMATCCTVCEENCHYPGCWWASNLSWCSMMKANHCTVCTNKCHYTDHVKEAKIYVTKKRKEKITDEILKNIYLENKKKISDRESDVKEWETKLQDLEKQKIKLVMEAFHCVHSLEMIALNTDSLIILLHIDFLIEKLKEIKEPEKAEILEDIKKRAGEEKHRALKYMKDKYEKSSGQGK
ncbi:uncharacterized protein LOC130218657 [Danio aesculapii]|uniref:uncharacterized protein LOC130218657 n=1 Tax=Danio aesculapii TaxID=1142201 RepID=UPI0024C0A6D1|nr:uncharacterized protein LOC130218657 [Danio aesculapii]